MMDVDEVKVKVATEVPNLQRCPDWNPVPVTVTAVPPAAGPFTSESEVTETVTKVKLKVAEAVLIPEFQENVTALDPAEVSMAGV
jgi:hypothetical protein